MSKSNRLSEAEDVMDSCAKALSLIPVWAFRRGHRWIPSDEAIELIADAKEALDKYARQHIAFKGENGH